jgi:hypothetical protein
MSKFLLYVNEIWRVSHKYLYFMKTETLSVQFLGTGEVNVVEAESLLAPFLQKFPDVCLVFQLYFQPQSITQC